MDDPRTRLLRQDTDYRGLIAQCDFPKPGRLHVMPVTAREIVDDYDVVSRFQQMQHGVATDVAGASRNNDALPIMIRSHKPILPNAPSIENERSSACKWPVFPDPRLEFVIALHCKTRVVEAQTVSNNVRLRPGEFPASLRRVERADRDGLREMAIGRHSRHRLRIKVTAGGLHSGVHKEVRPIAPNV